MGRLPYCHLGGKNLSAYLILRSVILVEQNHTASFTWGHCPVPPVVTYLGRTTVIMKSSSNVLKLLWEEIEKWKEEIFRMGVVQKQLCPSKANVILPLICAVLELMQTLVNA